MLRSFICKTRSSTGLRVISASENRLKSPNTADEYNLQEHQGKQENKKKRNRERTFFFSSEWNTNMTLQYKPVSWLSPVAVSWLCSSCSTCSLISWSLWSPRDFKGWHSSHSVIETLLNATTVDHVLYARNGQRCLCHIGGNNTKTSTRWGRPEHLQQWITHMQYATEQVNQLHCSGSYNSPTTGQSENIYKKLWIYNCLH